MDLPALQNLSQNKAEFPVTRTQCPLAWSCWHLESCILCIQPGLFVIPDNRPLQNTKEEKNHQNKSFLSSYWHTRADLNCFVPSLRAGWKVAYQSRCSKSWLLLKGWGSPGQHGLSNLPSTAVGQPQRWPQVQITRQPHGDNTGPILSKEVKSGSYPASAAEVRHGSTVARQVYSDKTINKQATCRGLEQWRPAALLQHYWKKRQYPQAELKWSPWAGDRVDRGLSRS